MLFRFVTLAHRAFDANYRLGLFGYGFGCGFGCGWGIGFGHGFGRFGYGAGFGLGFGCGLGFGFLSAATRDEE